MSVSNFVDVTVAVNGPAAVDRAQFNRPLFITSTPTTTTRLQGPYADLAELSDDYGPTTEPYKWATAVFSQEIAPNEVMIGEQLAGDSGDWSTTFDAILVAETSAKGFYAINIESRTEAHILDIAVAVEASGKIMIVQSDDAGILTGEAGNVALDLQTAAYNRTALIYHAADGEYLDGAWTGRCLGMNLDTENGAGIWGLKQLAGVPFDELTGSQAAEIEDANANYYGRLKGVNFTSPGKMASGRFIDIQTTVDWVKARLEERILARLVGSPTKIPFTDVGIAVVKAEFFGVLLDGVAYGHFSPDSPPIVTAPRRSEISDETAATRVVSMTGEVVFAGAIQKVTINLNARF